MTGSGKTKGQVASKEIAVRGPWQKVAGGTSMGELDCNVFVAHPDVDKRRVLLAFVVGQTYRTRDNKIVGQYSGCNPQGVILRTRDGNHETLDPTKLLTQDGGPPTLARLAQHEGYSLI